MNISKLFGKNQYAHQASVYRPWVGNYTHEARHAIKLDISERQVVTSLAMVVPRLVNCSLKERSYITAFQN